MSGNSVLFHWLDINWTLTKCLAVAGVLLMLVGAALFIGLFKHVKGKVQRMSEEEALDSVLNATRTGGDIRTSPVLGKAVGVKAELNCNIDTLRRAARRGDWLTFWLWPSMMSCGSIGICLLLLAFVPRQPIFIVLTSLMPAFIIFVAWFMPWAAIYTNIDLNADAQPPAADDRAQPPQR